VANDHLPGAIGTIFCLLFNLVYHLRGIGSRTTHILVLLSSPYSLFFVPLSTLLLFFILSLDIDAARQAAQGVPGSLAAGK